MNLDFAIWVEELNTFPCILHIAISDTVAISHIRIGLERWEQENSDTYSGKCGLHQREGALEASTWTEEYFSNPNGSSGGLLPVALQRCQERTASGNVTARKGYWMPVNTFLPTKFSHLFGWFHRSETR